LSNFRMLEFVASVPYCQCEQVADIAISKPQ
jgi:hypothetical protein